MPLPRRYERRSAAVFWHADSWLPSEYEKAGFVVQAMSYALSKQGLRCDRIMACVNPRVFPYDLLERYIYSGVFIHSRDDEREALKDMLANLVAQARFRRISCFAVVAKLSQHTEMITRVLASLIHRGIDVVLVVPEVNEPNNFGIYRGASNLSTLSLPLPVWVCPLLFDEALPWVCPLLFDEALPLYPKTAGEREALEIERQRRMAAGEQDEDEDEDEKYFMQLPAPQITTFSMPPNVTTCVFWDVKDYPVPQGLDPGQFFENIKSAFSSSGDLSIYAYGVAEDLDSLPPSYLDAGITLVKAPADQVSRALVMLVDISLWSMDNSWRTPPLVSNILVITKDEMTSNNRFGIILGGLISRGRCKVFLALPDDDSPTPPGFKDSVLRWETLSARGGKKRMITREEGDTVSASRRLTSKNISFQYL